MNTAVLNGFALNAASPLVPPVQAIIAVQFTSTNSRPGDTLTATVTAANSTGGAITNATLTIDLPAGIVGSVTLSQGTFTLTGSILTVVLGTIAAGATPSVVATIEANAAGTATVSASLSSDQVADGPAGASVTTVQRVPTASGLDRLGGRPKGLPPGVYSLKKTTDGLDLSTLPPGIVGIFFQTNWKQVETAQDVFNWAPIDQVIADAADLGLVVSLSLGMGGGQTPAYVLSLPGVATLSYINTSTFQSTAGQAVTIPLPWDATALARKVNFIRQAGLRYASNPAVRAVQVNALACGQSNDWYLPTYQGNYTMPDSSVVVLDQVAQWQAAGYSTAKALGAAQTLIDAAAYYFPGRMVKQPIANADPDLEAAPSLDVRTFTLGDQVMAFGWNRYPNRFLPSWERLKATTPLPTDPAVTGAAFDASNYKYTLLASHPKRFGFQEASAATNGASDNYRMNGGTPGDVVTIFQNAMSVAIAYKAHYAELWADEATNPDLAEAISATTDAMRTIHAGN